MKYTLSTLALAAGILAVSTAARADDHFSVWTGADFAPSSTYGYLGGFYTLGDHTVDQEGWLLRASGGYGHIHYDTTPGPGGEFTDHLSTADLMIGYQALSGPASAKFFIGPDYQHLSESPVDPNTHRGTHVGAKAQAEVNTKLYESVGLEALGSYSTAFQTYWSRITPSYQTRWFSIGPEGSFLGSQNFNQVRAGGAIGDVKLGPVNLRADAGKAWTHGTGKDGAYGGLSVGSHF